MIKEAIATAVEGIDLTEEMAQGTMEEIMDGEATPAQIAAFLVSMRLKGETVQEIAAFARTMRARSRRINPRVKGRIVDTCGTGGDGLKKQVFFDKGTIADLDTSDIIKAFHLAEALQYRQRTLSY